MTANLGETPNSKLEALEKSQNCKSQIPSKSQISNSTQQEPMVLGICDLGFGVSGLLPWEPARLTQDGFSGLYQGGNFLERPYRDP